MKGSLEGRKILLTRARDQGASLERAIRDLGGEPLWVPAIETVPLALGPRERRRLKEIAYFDWVAFTSVNALTYLLVHLDALGGVLPEAMRIAAVGSATARACRARGLAVEAMPSIFTGSALGELLAERYSPAKLLLPTSTRSKGALPSVLGNAGWTVVVFPCYETRHASLDGRSVELIEEGVDAALFASPSAVEGLWQGLPGLARESLKRTLCVPIGPTTERALREKGLRTAEPPPRSTSEEMVRALVTALGPIT